MDYPWAADLVGAELDERKERIWAEEKLHNRDDRADPGGGGVPFCGYDGGGGRGEEQQEEEGGERRRLRCAASVWLCTAEQRWLQRVASGVAASGAAASHGRAATAATRGFGASGTVTRRSGGGCGAQLQGGGRCGVQREVRGGAVARYGRLRLHHQPPLPPLMGAIVFTVGLPLSPPIGVSTFTDQSHHADEMEETMARNNAA
uniref:Uncharacterized protein n=1 Tax=Oryza punctata TaxID=4537 RepID=A0A0E0LBQ4_ORYPU